MDRNAKYSIAHSRAWDTSRSNLAKCKFTLELFDQASCRTAPYRSKQKAPKEETLSEIEPVISSIAQGPAKNMIKID